MRRADGTVTTRDMVMLVILSPVWRRVRLVETYIGQPTLTYVRESDDLEQQLREIGHKAVCASSHTIFTPPDHHPQGRSVDDLFRIPVRFFCVLTANFPPRAMIPVPPHRVRQPDRKVGVLRPPPQ